jgi:hydroxymethylglutaryl-CoA synthase
MGVLRSFRVSRQYRREVLDKMALGSDTMLDLGNLYTAALPAWLAAGFEQALDEGSLQEGEEVLTLGYGSGDAAEVIPFFMAEGWREAAAKIDFAAAMRLSVDLDMDQYHALHDGRRIAGLDYIPNKEFVIDRVGHSDERHFTDLGIEYYRYVG